jgi:hypothetical protein
LNRYLIVPTRPATYENDLAKEIGGSQIGRVRSLRRALQKLCDAEIVQIVGLHQPHKYRKHSHFVAFSEGVRQYEEKTGKKFDED